MQGSLPRARLGLVVVALVASLAALLPTRGVAAAGDRDHPYLALGDSVAFGFIPSPPLPPVDYFNPANFVSYADDAAGQLDEQLTNASCPGETTSSFISTSGPDNGCNNFYRLNFPLHTNYAGPQLDFAVSFLKTHTDTHLVTIDLGANDIFLLQHACALALNPTACFAAGLPGTLATIGTNLDTIFSKIRNVAHYDGDLVALSYYALDYEDHFGKQVTNALNAVISAEVHKWHGHVANGFGAFREASDAFDGSTCLAGLRIALGPGVCDVHPTPLGHSILADEVVEAA